MILLSSTKLRQWATSATIPLPIYEMTSRESKTVAKFSFLNSAP